MMDTTDILDLYLDGWDIAEISKLLHAPQDEVTQIIQDEIGFDEGWKME